MTPDWGIEQGHGGGVAQWWAWVEALVRARGVEVVQIGREDPAQVAFVNDQDPVE